MDERRKEQFKLRRCGTCGNDFEPTSSASKFCSPRCRFIEISSAFKDSPGCWNWPLAKRQNGYGQFMVEPRPNQSNQLAHRLSYKFLVGDIPNGLFVLHNCDNRACFNPLHLRLGTQAENLQDMVARRRHLAHTDPALHSSIMKAAWELRRERGREAR